MVARTPEIIDFGTAPELFGVRLVRMSKAGPCVRLSFANPELMDRGDGNREVLAVKFHVYVPASELTALARQLTAPVFENGADLIDASWAEKTVAH